MKKWFWIIWVVSIKSHSSWKAENLSQLWSVKQRKWKNECEQLHVCQHTPWQQNGVSERWQCVKNPVHHGQFEDGEREQETQKETKNCWSLDFSPDRPTLDHWSNQQFQSIIFSTHFYKTFFGCNSVQQSLLSDFFFLSSRHQSCLVLWLSGLPF